MPEFRGRRGREAAEAAASRKGGEGSSKFAPFVPEIKWTEDGAKKYILVLSDPDEVATCDIHEFIKVGVKEKSNGETYPDFQQFMSRKDPLIGEDYDDLQDRLDSWPKTRVLGVVAELEPVMEVVRGRQRPKGFAVKTNSFTRRTDDGEVEVTYPVIGIVQQSSALMWSPLLSLDDSQGPWIELPVEVTRRAMDANTRYEFVPFMDAPVDLSPIVDFYDGISYLRDDLDELKGIVDSCESEQDKAMAVAEALLNKRLIELSDKDRYDALVGPIQKLEQKFPKGKQAAKKPALSRSSSIEESAPVTPRESTRADRFETLKAKVEAKSSES